MTDEERRLIVELNERLTRMEAKVDKLTSVEAKVDEMYRELMQPSATGEPALIKRAYAAVQVIERSGWVGKMMVRLIIGAGSIAGAVTGMIVLWHRLKGG